jgi:cyclic beta-1,2-glucan synthetase
MTNDVFYISAAPRAAALLRLREAGIAAAAWARRTRGSPVQSLRRPRELLSAIAAAAPGLDSDVKACLLDNLPLVRSAAAGARELRSFARRSPVVAGAFGVAAPRVCVIAREYLRAAGNAFSEDGFIRFLQGYQEAAELETGEIEHLKPALELAVLERLAVAAGDVWPVLLSSLRRVGEVAWRELCESVSVVDRVLRRDPARAYPAMDSESRAGYRRAVVALAEQFGRTEREIAELAVALAEQNRGQSPQSPVFRRSHVGFYLVDRGLQELRAAAGCRAPLADRFRDLMNANPVFYPAGIEVLTFAIVAALVSQLGGMGTLLAAILFLLLPVSQAAVDFMNHLVALVVPPRTLPKLDFSKGIPADCATVVAVPALLLNEAQVRNLVFDLEIRFLANRDGNLYFALLTDPADSDRPVDERDELVAVCRDLIEGLNRKYRSEGRTPFYLFHRNRVFNPSEERWIGWERKRGKLLELNRLLRGLPNGFTLTAGDLAVLPAVRYVITLDCDTQLPRDAAARLIGTIAHPLNRAVVHPLTRTVVEGYGILQPRIGISVKSAARSRLAAIYSGQTGFDIYTHAVSEVYQDLFGEGIYTGKGIYDVDVLREVLEHRFPENALLSHDLIEGAYARAGLVSDIELIDDYPSHFSAYSRRKHRWIRGDWQITRWLLERVPDSVGRTIPNPIGIVSQWKIVDNLRRSVLEPSMLLLLLAGWLFLPGGWYWTAAALAVLLLPALENLLFSPAHPPQRVRMLPGWGRDVAGRFVVGCLQAILSLVFLLHQALLSVDAIARSLLRVSITRRRLLQWETAAEVETGAAPKATVDTYLRWTPWLSAGIGLAVWLVAPAALGAALPVLALWFLSRGISAYLNRAPRTGCRDLDGQDVQLLRESSERICRFFDEWSSAATNWLIPDSVREHGKADLRLSPTNLGFLLNARIAAVHFGVLSLDRFVLETRRTLEQAGRLAKHRGHLLNWYAVRSMAPIEPRFVSTVDSGNLVACLWTLKQAALAFAAEPPSARGLTAALAAGLEEIAGTCDRWVREMDFAFLYQEKKKVLSVGYDVSAGRLAPSSYDLLASEASIAAFVAIAKGDIPKEAWFHLGRAHNDVRGARALVSWTGTMFEYLMPLLWMRHHPGTIVERSAAAAVRIQRDFAARKGVPWGISESGSFAGNGWDYGYAAFGIPDLAMRRTGSDPLVVSPYSTFLALAVDPAAAVENLRRERELGWWGRYGFYEAVDFRHSQPEPVRSWMAHHQGMSLLAACNVLFDNPMRRYFHAEPQVLATELLLDERVPRTAMAEAVWQFQPFEEVLELRAG